MTVVPRLPFTRLAAEKKMFNCHIHLFHLDHVPRRFPNLLVHSLGSSRFAKAFLSGLLKITIPWSKRDNLERWANFLDHATEDSQADLFEIVSGHYPSDACFVVLPMDMRGLEKGLPRKDIEEQHEQLAKLAKDFPEKIIPFIHIDPRSGSDDMSGPNALEFIEKLHQEGIDGVKFKGIKLYPPYGYSANDECVDKIFQYANTHRLPITAHCMSRGGVWTESVPKETLVDYTAPCNYVTALKKYPDMKLCLAHFGGYKEWDDYLARDNNADLALEDMDWVSQIVTMMKSGDYPNLYADISYTLFKYQDYAPTLSLLLLDPKIGAHTLFGSDFYMSEQNKLPERKLSVKLRRCLGEDAFWKIAHDNPKRFLGSSP